MPVCGVVKIKILSYWSLNFYFIIRGDGWCSKHWGLSLLASITVLLSSGVLTWIILRSYKLGVYVIAPSWSACIHNPVFFILSLSFSIYLINIHLYGNNICECSGLSFLSLCLSLAYSVLPFPCLCMWEASILFSLWPIVGFLKNIWEI